MTFVQCEIREKVAVVTLSNPPLNVVTLSMTAELEETLERLRPDDAVRALVLKGAGERAFCAGSDIVELLDMLEPGRVVPMKLARQKKVFGALEDFSKPTFAAVSGLVYGGGLEIAMCCDFIIIEEDTRLAQAEIKLGVFPSSGGLLRLARRIGIARAKDMAFFGEPITAETAFAWGLVNRIAPKGECLQTALEMAAILVNERSSCALEHSKALLNAAFDDIKEDALNNALESSDKVFSSPGAKEGIRAFLEKRKPDFRHH